MANFSQVSLRAGLSLAVALLVAAPMRAHARGDSAALQDGWCWVPGTPGLQVKAPWGATVGMASYSLAPVKVTRGQKAELTIHVQKGTEHNDWEGVFPTWLSVEAELQGEDAKHRTRARTARIVVDGEALSNLEVLHAEHPLEDSYAPDFRVQPRNQLDVSDATNVLSKGKRAVVTVQDGSGDELGRYEFDLAPLHDVPEAIRRSRFHCPRGPALRLWGRTFEALPEDRPVPQPGSETYVLDHADKGHAVLVHRGSVRSTGATTRVRTTVIQPEEGFVKTGGALHSIEYEHEIDCKAEKSRTVSATLRVFLTETRQVLRDHAIEPQEWTPLTHGQMGAMACEGDFGDALTWRDLDVARAAYRRALAKHARESDGKGREPVGYYTDVRPLTVGRPVEGVLGGMDTDDADGFPRDRYTFKAKAGESFRVTMRAGSDTPYLRILKDETPLTSSFRLLKLAAVTSPLIVEFEQAGEYTVEVNTLEGFDDVTYTLLLEREEPEEE